MELSRQVLKLKIYNMISEGGGLTTYQLLSSKTEVKLFLLQKAAVKNLPGVDGNRTTESGRRSWPSALVGEACVSVAHWHTIIMRVSGTVCQCVIGSTIIICVSGIGTVQCANVSLAHHYHYHQNH